MQVNNLIKTAKEITSKTFKTSTNAIRRTFSKEEDTFERGEAQSQKTVESYSKINSIDLPFYQPAIEKVFIAIKFFTNRSPFSEKADVAKIEETLKNKGVVVRFNNDLKTANYINEGISELEKRGIRLPTFILFHQPKSKYCIDGQVLKFRNKTAHKAPIEFTSNIASGLIFDTSHASTSNKLHAFYHEIGHYLHHSNIPDNKTCMNIWSKADKKLVKEEVSEDAIRDQFGMEFVAEVFAGLMDGKEYSKPIMETYHQLKGPIPKQIN